MLQSESSKNFVSMCTGYSRDRMVGKFVKNMKPGKIQAFSSSNIFNMFIFFNKKIIQKVFKCYAC